MAEFSCARLASYEQGRLPRTKSNAAARKNPRRRGLGEMSAGARRDAVRNRAAGGGGSTHGDSVKGDQNELLQTSVRLFQA